MRVGERLQVGARRGDAAEAGEAHLHSAPRPGRTAGAL